MQNQSYLQIRATHDFESIRRQAQLSRLWHNLAGRAQTLLPFGPVFRRLPNRTGIYRGIQEIPLEQVVGSVGRADEFDRAFRPLKNSLRQRWVNIRVLQGRRGWQAIQVRQVGNLYFVEDGHHRVSVARSEGLTVIEASVMEYPVPLSFHTADSLDVVLRRLEELKLMSNDTHMRVTNLTIDVAYV